MESLKKTAIITMAVLVFASCKKDDIDDQNPIENSVLGTFKLVETLADPGDGSGTFQPVTSNKSIELLSDGTFTSNGDVCSLNQEASSQSAGVYSINDSIINPDSCDALPMSIIGSELILTYFCIEPCKAKYLKQ